MPQHRPTILQIIPRLDIGGAERTTVEITEAIVTAGGRALVVAEGGRLVPQITQAGGEFIAMDAASKNPLTILGNARKLQRLIAQESVDLLHARSRAPAWSALITARRSQKPFVTTYHGAYNEGGMIKKTYNSIMARGDLVIANSRYTARLIDGRYGTPERKIRVIHRGMDDTFNPERVSPERIARLRSDWGITPRQKVILNAARLTAWKGQGVVIEAAAKVFAHNPAAEWVVIIAGDAQGRTEYENKLREQIAACGLADRVRLVGGVADMPAAYMASDATVVASIEPEAFGRSAAEAEAMRCPVIATSIGAAPETILSEPAVAPEQTTGWLVPPGDADALARRLIDVLSLTAQQRVQIGDRARQHVMDNFTLAAMQQATLRVYDELLGSQLANQARS